MNYVWLPLHEHFKLTCRFFFHPTQELLEVIQFFITPAHKCQIDAEKLTGKMHFYLNPNQKGSVFWNDLASQLLQCKILMGASQMLLDFAESEEG
jgi:hypothetical protein